jgi:hypothetical protein
MTVKDKLKNIQLVKWNCVLFFFKKKIPEDSQAVYFKFFLLGDMRKLFVTRFIKRE